MAETLTQPRHRINVASTVALLLAGMLTAPVLAAPERGLVCAENGNSTTAFTATELSVTLVSSSEEMLEDHLLRPRAKAAARGAFAEETAEDKGLIDVEEVLAASDFEVAQGDRIEIWTMPVAAVVARPVTRR